jgi:hypothetical protein
VKPPRPPIFTQQPFEHISQLELVHCVAPLLEQVAQDVPAAATTPVEGEAAALAPEGEAAAPAAEGEAAAPAAPATEG